VSSASPRAFCCARQPYSIASTAGSLRKSCRSQTTSDRTPNPIEVGRSAGDLQFLARLMQFPRVGVAHGGVQQGVTADFRGDARRHAPTGICIVIWLASMSPTTHVGIQATAMTAGLPMGERGSAASAPGRMR
jgi:hypothetical protein